MLSINNLHVEVNGNSILKGLNLNIPAGEIHALMGPNGSGKSTLAYTLTGHQRYTVTAGNVNFKGYDLFSKSIEERARLGVFLAFQYPTEIPGITNINLLKAAVNAQRKADNKEELDAMDFLSLIKEKLALVKMDESLLYRPVNDGFSGGEKKRNEILQMAVLQPSLAILDETDSGLDIDALRVVANGVNNMRNAQRSFLLITHYQRLLDYICPDHIHIMIDGKIIKSGDRYLAQELEKHGYEQYSSLATQKKPTQISETQRSTQ